MQVNSNGFKVGDTVLCNRSCRSANRQETYIIFDDSQQKPNDPLAIGSDKDWACHCITDWSLIKSNSNAMTSLKEKFALAFKGEPEKSFIKAGVMNTDESLTTDGKEIFLAYLLKKNGDDFKTTVIDPILAADAATE